ncbi:MAG: glutaminase [Lewinellaceae bacterium]|nr:glutaminase [Lewinellaceae bacterium]
MLSCGFYDEAGELAFRVGLPGKSGVGGGTRCTVAAWKVERSSMEPGH